MINLCDYNFDEISALVKEQGQPAYRAGQLFKWINQYADFDSMTDLPKNFTEALAQNYYVRGVDIVKTFKSVDGTEKFIYRLKDGAVIEGALMKQSYGNTLCVSTQVGCRMGCAFCASGLNGLVRNLTAGEILGQVLAVEARDSSTRVVTNVVMMGSGEPLDNYKNSVKFIKLLSDPKGLSFSERNISLSTCGLADKIIRLADEDIKVTLSLSLHATTDDVRNQIMPISNKYKIHEVMSAVKYYFEKTGRRPVIEYTMIKGLNVNHFDAKRLRELTKGFPVHVNLIQLNKVPEKNLMPCSPAEAERFLERLKAQNVSATLRKSKGSDISGACGQLRNKFVGDLKGKNDPK